MFKNILFPVCFCFLFSHNLDGQDVLEFDKNVVFGTFLGNAQTIVSVNYERLFQSKKRNFLFYSAGVGIGVDANTFDEKTFFSFPVEGSMYLGGKHNLETGVGTTFFVGTSDLNDVRIPANYKTNFDYSFSFHLGYRFISDNGFLFRLSPMLIIRKDPPLGNNYKFFPFGGFSFGKCF
ncbi:MAG: hypothetical protein H0U27_02880 [Nitrosopumilus sp.]|nr:hypothetical protein [Nitrosopumilus sp.]